MTTPLQVLQIGGTGTLGSAVAEVLRERGHELHIADQHSSEAPIDITDSSSIAAAYAHVGTVDAVVSTVGLLDLAPLPELALSHVRSSADGKLFSQIDLVLQGLPFVRRGGSFTLIAGIMSHIPWRGGIAAAVANGGLEGFVLAAAAELDEDRRINAISPSILAETVSALDGVNPLPGHTPVSAREVALTYVRSIEGIETGKTFRVGY